MLPSHDRTTLFDIRSTDNTSTDTEALPWTLLATPWPSASDMVGGFEGLDWAEAAGPFASRREAIATAFRV